jgi:hemerythrin-like domain-containing protein
MPTATEILKNEHQAILKMVEASETIAERLKQGKRVPSDILKTFQEFFQIFTDQCHHGKEEEIFFPLLEARGMPKAGGPLGVMLQEHDLGRGLVREMRQAAEAYAAGVEGSGARWAEAADQYAALLRAHIDKENLVLFPMAERMVSRNELERVAGEFEKLEVAKMGAGTHERLHAKMGKLLEEVYAAK